MKTPGENNKSSQVRICSSLLEITGIFMQVLCNAIDTDCKDFTRVLLCSKSGYCLPNRASHVAKYALTVCLQLRGHFN